MSLILMCLGTAISFITNPDNTTTCLGSNATFMCGTDKTVTLSWLINDNAYTEVPGAQATDVTVYHSTLTVPTYRVPNGTNVRCYFVVNGVQSYSHIAYLFVQGLFTCLFVCLFPLPCSCAILHPISSTHCTF